MSTIPGIPKPPYGRKCAKCERSFFEDSYRALCMECTKAAGNRPTGVQQADPVDRPSHAPLHVCLDVDGSMVRSNGCPSARLAAGFNLLQGRHT